VDAGPLVGRQISFYLAGHIETVWGEDPIVPEQRCVILTA
jgi:hypothetical protein